MASVKAERNRTIDTPLEEGTAFLDRCLTVSEPHRNLAGLLDRTVLGDMLEVCALLPPKSVDLIIADPPYNRTKSFHGTTFSKKKEAAYEAYTRQWLSAVKPLLKDRGSIYVCCDWESSLIVGRVLRDFFRIQNRITWQREKGRGAAENWKNGMEDIWFATNGKDYTFNLDAVKIRKKVIAPYRVDGKPKDWTEAADGGYRDTCPSNFWDDITIPFWSMAENTAHPTQKSEKLIAKIMLASSSGGDVVLDPFLGSGTTSVVAKKLGRHYLGIEREPLYCVWAEQRLAMAEDDRKIQGYTDGVFWERNSLPEQTAKRKKASPGKGGGRKKTGGTALAEATGAKNSKAGSAKNSKAGSAKNSKAGSAKNSKAGNAENSKTEGAKNSKTEGAENGKTGSAKNSKAGSAENGKAGNAKNSKAGNAENGKTEGEDHVS